MTRPILHDYYRSSAAYRVRIALNLKGVDYDHHIVNLAQGEQKYAAFRATNPQGLIPCLEIDGLVLTQSLAICDYLDANYDPVPFVPKDPADVMKNMPKRAPPSTYIRLSMNTGGAASGAEDDASTADT